jgi:hypothetical protein
MEPFFRLPGAVVRDPAVTAWFAAEDPLRLLVAPWFEGLRGLGPDLRECLHDGQPTACIGDVALAYVDAFTHHASIGFFFGSSLPDPAGLLQGTGKRMRHVKLRLGQATDPAALQALIDAAERDLRQRLRQAGPRD